MTLIEVMIATAVSAITLMMVTSAMLNFTTSSFRIQNQVKDEQEQKQFATRFVPIVESASIASSYQNLPIKFATSGACDAMTVATPEACVREMDATTRQFSSFDATTWEDASSAANDTTIQFYRDQYGKVSTRSAQIGNFPCYEAGLTTNDCDSASPTIQWFGNIAIPNSHLSRNLYATWVLKDTASKPFLMLRQSNVFNYLTFDWIASDTSNYSATPAGQYSRWKISTNASTFSASLISGSVILIYDSSNPDINLFQYINAVTDCTTGGASNSCNSLGAGYVGLDLRSMTNVAEYTTAGNKYYATTPDVAVATRMFLDRTGAALSSDFYPFSTEASTLYDSGATAVHNSLFDIDGTKNSMDIRKILYYYDRAYNAFPEPMNPPAFFAVPVASTSFYLEAQTSGPSPLPGYKVTSYRLVAKTFNNQAGGFILRILENVTGNVVFARRIGETSIHVFLYNAAGQIYSLNVPELIRDRHRLVRGLYNGFSGCSPLELFRTNPEAGQVECFL